MAAPKATAKRQLVLHIGMPKAGSKSIQWMLDHLAPQLVERGIDMFVDVDGKARCRATTLGTELKIGKVRKFTPQKLVRIERWRKLAAQMRRSKAPQFIISNESFLGIPKAGLPEMLAAMAADGHRTVHVIAYVRPQCQLLESRYAQWIMNCVERLPFHAFTAATMGSRPVERHPWLNYRHVLAPWRKVFGDQVTIVPLERSRMPRGLLPHFLDHIGAGDLDVSGARNRLPRRGAKFLEANRLISSALLQRGVRPSRELRSRKRRIPKLLRSDLPFTGLTADEARLLMQRFEAENAAFAREYAIDSSGILFRDPVIDDRARPNVATWGDLDDAEQEAVRAFARQTVGVDPAPRGRTPTHRIPLAELLQPGENSRGRWRFNPQLLYRDLWYRNPRR